MAGRSKTSALSLEPCLWTGHVKCSTTNPIKLRVVLHFAETKIPIHKLKDPNA